MAGGLSCFVVGCRCCAYQSASGSVSPVSGRTTIGVPVTGLLQMGVQTKSLYASRGGVGLCTIEQVNTAVASLKSDKWKDEQRQEGAAEYSKYVAAIDLYDGTGEKPSLVAFNC